MPDRQRLTDTLIDLIKIDSPTGEEDAIDAHLSNRLANLGATVRHDDYGNLVATLPGSNGAGDQIPVMLSAHMDTVDPGRGIKPMLDADGETLRLRRNHHPGRRLQGRHRHRAGRAHVGH